MVACWADLMAENLVAHLETMVELLAALTVLSMAELTAELMVCWSVGLTVDSTVDLKVD